MGIKDGVKNRKIIIIHCFKSTSKNFYFFFILLKIISDYTKKKNFFYLIDKILKYIFNYKNEKKM
jgi:hypothetical protein